MIGSEQYSVHGQLSVVFVLANGNPPELELNDHALVSVYAAADLAERYPDLDVVCVGGNVPEGYLSTARQMAVEFGCLTGKNAQVLDRSNHTLGNVREILEYLKKIEIRDMNYFRFGIVSTRSHLPRVEKIMRRIGISGELIAAESLAERYSLESKTMVARAASPDVTKHERIYEVLGMIYDTIDRNYIFVGIWRKLMRRMKAYFHHVK